MTEHTQIEPTKENGWASWYCTTCNSECSSDWPCDHCMQSLQDWAHEESSR